jgi:hypothetical protein
VPAIQIGALVGAIGSEPANVVGSATGDGQHLQHVPERLFKLRHKLFGFEFLVGIPADLSGDEFGNQRLGGLAERVILKPTLSSAAPQPAIDLATKIA